MNPFAILLTSFVTGRCLDSANYGWVGWKVLVAWAILAGWIVAGIAFSGCAGISANSAIGVSRPALTYTCSLDAERCALVANAAAISTAEGWPVAESRDGDIRFLPGPAESVWAGACDVEMVGRWPVARLCVSHALEVGPPGIVRVNIVPGALYRRSDFVTLVLDNVFVPAEGR